MPGFHEVLKEYGHSSRFHAFQNLMQYRIRKVLLVCSLYDSFIFEEDGQLYERLYSEHHNLSLITVPTLVRVSSGKEALERIPNDDIDLVITTLNPGDMHALDFAQKVRAQEVDVPVVLLTYDERGLSQLASRHDLGVFENVFLWQGDFRILIAIIKHIEDRRNVEHDTEAVGVQSIILIEDSVHFYSSYLPTFYTQIFHHSLTLISESLNASQRFLRMRARPKILLCTTYEQAWDYYLTYYRCVLGVVSDIKFPREGKIDPEAGLRFARHVKQSHSDIPILLQSNQPKLRRRAEEIGASFLYKSSPTLLKELQEFIKRYFSFGDFVFNLEDGSEVGRAADLRQFEKMVAQIPPESLRYHAERNHFSNWLKARTEFWLAHRLRASKIGHFGSIEGVREHLLSSLAEWRRERYRGTVVDFDAENFETTNFARIGGGSLGGKARGLGFTLSLLANFNLRNRIPGVAIEIPPAVVLATSVFDRFLDENELREFALHSNEDEEIHRRFLRGTFPPDILRDLLAFIDRVSYPLAVRSSSLLEDSRYLPFAGVYDTIMLANNSNYREIRRAQFLSAIKRVYASTYTQQSKAYIKSTPFRLEEEKMAVIVQKLVGTTHGSRFYPDFSGVVRSHNYYPRPPMRTEDGIANVALGLGESVVGGYRSIQFCPKYPRHSTQFSDVRDTLRSTQNRFYALELPDPGEAESPEQARLHVQRYELEDAEEDGTLASVASTYSPDNDALYDGVAREGHRVVTFAPILKSEVFRLASILELICDMGHWAMNSPVEIEFAVNLSTPPGARKEFAFLQMRPMVAGHELEELSIDDVDPAEVLCRSPQVLGNGVIDDIYDVVLVDPEKFERNKSRSVAYEFKMFNGQLTRENRNYLAIGMGRWGTSDPWLGIPVTYDQISGARIIIEAGMKDITVEPSQGSHFFQNLSSFGIGYFTVGKTNQEEWIDWDWLMSQPRHSERNYVYHLRFEEPLLCKMNGHQRAGVVCRPGTKES